LAREVGLNKLNEAFEEDRAGAVKALTATRNT
jgi:hypothetical protein